MTTENPYMGVDSATARDQAYIWQQGYDAAMRDRAQAKTDWTVRDGRSNSSDLYLEIVEEVARRMCNLRVGSDPIGSARALVSWLAYEKGMAPS